MLTDWRVPSQVTAVLCMTAWLFSCNFVVAQHESPAKAQGVMVVEVPTRCLRLPVRVALPSGSSIPDATQCSIEVAKPEVKLAAEVLAGPSPDGTHQAAGYLLVNGATTEAIPEQETGAISLQFRLVTGRAESAETPTVFRWEETSEATLTLREDQDKPVLAYNFGQITNPNVPEKDPRRTRSCYIHPVWGLRGEIMTDDFPRDHYHHHGIFWTWPHVVIREQEFSLWEDKGALRQRFRKWLCRSTSPNSATLGVENGWMLDDECLLTERVWITVYRTGSLGRFIDIDLFLLPHVPVTLWGAEGKSYGGLTMRFRPPSEKEARITVPDGLTTNDLYETRLPWADFTSRFGTDETLSGGTIMIAPDHPDFPPTWLTRHYGPLCIGWPGIESRTLEPGTCTRLSYRLWIHSDLPSAADIQQLYDLYTTASRLSCLSANAN